MAADQEARRPRVAGWDAEDHAAVRQDRPDERRGQGTSRGALDERHARRNRRDRPRRRRRGAAPGLRRADARDARDAAVHDPDWLFEIKWDGYRLQAIVDDGTGPDLHPRGLDGETYFPKLLTPATWIAARRRSSTARWSRSTRTARPISAAPGGDQRAPQRLARSRRRPGPGRPRPHLVYQAFDLLYLDGRSLLKVPLEDRKRLLRSVLQRVEPGPVRVARRGRRAVAFHAAASRLGLEGIVAKLRRSTLRAGPPLERLAEDQDPARAGARRRWLDARRGQCQGSRRGRRRRVRGRPAAVRGQGRLGVLRAHAQRTSAGASPTLETDIAPFDPAPERRGELGTRDVGPARARDPGRAGRLDARRLRSTDGVQGIDEGHDPKAVTRERPVDSGEAAAEAEERMPIQRKAPTKTKPAAAAASAKSCPKAAPKSSVRSTQKAKRAPSASRTFAAATADELDALAKLPNEGLWSVAGHELKLTNLDKTLFAPLDGTDDPPITKRELIVVLRPDRPGDAAAPRRAAAQPSAVPERRGRPGVLAEGHPLERARLAPALAGGRGRRTRGEHPSRRRQRRGRCAGSATRPRSRSMPGPAGSSARTADVRPRRHRSRARRRRGTRRWRSPASTGPRSSTSDVRAYPKLTGKRGIQAWLPIEPKYEFHDDERLGREASRGQSGRWSRTSSRGSGPRRARKGRARLDYTQNTYIKTLVAPYCRPAGGRARRSRRRSAGRSSTTRSLRPNSFTIRNVVDRVAELGDLFAGAQTDLQELPKLG